MVNTRDRNGSATATASAWITEIFSSVQGEGVFVGRRQLFVRLAGCDVGCRFCDTPDSLRHGPACRITRPAQAGKKGLARAENPIGVTALRELLAEFVHDHGPFQALAVTGGEPLEQVEFLAALLPDLELPVLLETAGTLPDALERVIDHLAIVSMDLKLPSVAGVADCFELHRRFLRIALRKELYVKVVVNERVAARDWDQALALMAELAPGVPFFVQPETDRTLGLRVGFDQLSDLAELARRAGLTDVRILPQIHPLLGAP